MSWGFDPFDDRQQPPMSAEMFTTLVVSRLRSRGITVEAQRRLEVTVSKDGVSTVARLDPYYRRYRADPAALTSLIQGFTQDLTVGQAKLADPDSFEGAATNLLPLLISSTEWQKKRTAGVRMVVRPLVEDLGIALVVDQPEMITYVELERFSGWGIDIASAYGKAMENLERRARDISVSQIGEGEETLLIDRSTDGYAATRALLHSRLEDWSRRVPGRLVLGVPSRGFLIGFSSAHPNLDSLAAQIEKDAQADEQGLSPRLLTYRGGELKLYADDND